MEAIKLERYRVVITWIDKTVTFRYVDARNTIHAEGMIMDSFNAIERGLVDTVRAHKPS